MNSSRGVIRQGSPYSFQALLWPDLFGLVIVLKRGCSPGKLKPGHFSSGVNVNIRCKNTRVVQGSNTNESDLRAMTVVAPKSRLAFAASIDVVRTISPGHRNSFQVATRHLYRRSLNNGVEDKSAARMSLAIGAMAAVHTDRLGQKLEPYLATGTAAPGFLAFRMRFLFHVLRYLNSSGDVL